MNKENMDRQRRIITVLVVLTIIFTFFGGSLAYFNWETATNQRTNIVFTVEQDFMCSADGGGSIESSTYTLVPTGCTDPDYAIQRTVTVNPTIYNTNNPVDMELWLEINELGTGLSNSQNFKYALTTSSTSCTEGLVEEGTFNGLTTGDTATILTNTYSATTTETYYLYIWLDAAETSADTMNQTFDLEINGSCTDEPGPYSESILNGASPQIDSTGMIPITLSDSGVATTVAAYSANWYSYENKQWANAVLVNKDARSKYLGTDGVTVTDTDILAYYVWIPKYSYKMNGTEEEISIAFNSTPDGYTSHPAFEYSNDMNGFWVGKFEPSTTDGNTTILPNKSSLRNQNVSTQFKTALTFSGGTLTDGVVTYAGNDTYGLTSKTDSHMMKNSEWGAVAYLSHSKYGINQEIYINNSSSYYTGRSGGNVGGSSVSATLYGSYNWVGQPVTGATTYGEATDRTLGTKASTTGNVYGIYDMSGGVWEYVMGVLADSEGNPRSGNSTSKNSGFNGALNSGTYEDGIAFPIDNKYYDLYTVTSMETCTTEECGGHALNETSGWYSDYAGFVSSSYPWFSRGGNYQNGAYAGALVSGSYYGSAYGDRSWRSVLVVG